MPPKRKAEEIVFHPKKRPRVSLPPQRYPEPEFKRTIASHDEASSSKSKHTNSKSEGSRESNSSSDYSTSVEIHGKFALIISIVVYLHYQTRLTPEPDITGTESALQEVQAILRQIESPEAFLFKRQHSMSFIDILIYARFVHFSTESQACSMQMIIGLLNVLRIACSAILKNSQLPLNVASFFDGFSLGMNVPLECYRKVLTIDPKMTVIEKYLTKLEFINSLLQSHEYNVDQMLERASRRTKPERGKDIVASETMTDERATVLNNTEKEDTAIAKDFSMNTIIPQLEIILQGVQSLKTDMHSAIQTINTIKDKIATDSPNPPLTGSDLDEEISPFQSEMEDLKYRHEAIQSTLRQKIKGREKEIKEQKRLYETHVSQLRTYFDSEKNEYVKHVERRLDVLQKEYDDDMLQLNDLRNGLECELVDVKRKFRERVDLDAVNIIDMRADVNKVMERVPFQIAFCDAATRRNVEMKKDSDRREVQIRRNEEDLQSRALCLEERERVVELKKEELNMRLLELAEEKNQSGLEG